MGQLHRRVVRVVAGIVAAWAVGVSSAWAIWPPSAGVSPPRLTRQARVISDTGGAIAEILLHYDPLCRPALAPVYRDLFLILPDRDLSLVVVCPTREAADDFESQWGRSARANGRQLTVVNADCDITVWARDRQIAREVAGVPWRAEMVVPAGSLLYGECKQNELSLPAFLWRQRMITGLQRTSLDIEGGNVVADDQHVFVGANIFSENMGRDINQVKVELRRVLGSGVVTIGDDDCGVPWDHVDMYLTPVGDGVVLLASPALAQSVLAASSGIGGDEGVRELLTEEIERVGMAQDQMDCVADALKTLGYTVRQLPAVVNWDEKWMITYNNVLMEHRDGQHIVYMPSYRIPALDNVAAGVYRDLGFKVRQVDMSELYPLGGALRCIANVTRRHATGSDTLWSSVPRARQRARRG